MTRPIWSMSRCFREKKRCRRPLRERHDATLDLYSSLSRFTTRGRQMKTGDERATKQTDTDSQTVSKSMALFSECGPYSIPLFSTIATNRRRKESRVKKED